MSHGPDTRSQTADIINWVFYHLDRPDHFSTIFCSDFCRIQKEDLDEIVADWIQPAFADRIRKRYNFDLNEDSIQIAKVLPLKNCQRVTGLMTAGIIAQYDRESSPCRQEMGEEYY
jgi:hypothetical protein